MPTIMVADDDPNVRSSFKRVLTMEGYSVDLCQDGQSALEYLEHNEPDMVLMDIRMPGKSGLEILKEIQPLNPQLPVVIMTAYGNADAAIEATRLGAYEYLPKPFEMEELIALVNEVLDRRDKMRAPVVLPDEAESTRSEASFVGSSKAMREVFKSIGLAAGTDETVLITGESGTGKELVARSLFQHSTRSNQVFLAVNCAAIPEPLLESELFGHERGAFTGANARHIGKFEQAHKGTIFLDEIGEIGMGVQAKMLRFLQEGTFQRVGGEETLKVDVRVLAATNKDLVKAVADKEFRADLYYRLNVLTIALPALRERTQDIPELAEYFIKRACQQWELSCPEIEPEHLQQLQQYRWPGNVRELENTVRRALILGQGRTLDFSHLAKAPNAESVGGWQQMMLHAVREAFRQCVSDHFGTCFDTIIAEAEKEIIAEALVYCNKNQVQAARLLGISRSTLRDRIEKFQFNSTTDS